ncbi:hypothetical protein EJ06DRAFT_37099 [Trichodelitschia bisporula]|uniref:Uncharacterized protein n=1 Tax=Trichodelitschia bisporula TaxID=703511 RepID=A0A6G1HVG3_9PEZI|nr:hypothetical protein EJ06DRAFT_37099 [Trichodelitschia bisporula]
MTQRRVAVAGARPLSAKRSSLLHDDSHRATLKFNDEAVTQSSLVTGVSMVIIYMLRSSPDA